VCDRRHSSRESTFLPVDTVNYVATLKAITQAKAEAEATALGLTEARAGATETKASFASLTTEHAAAVADLGAARSDAETLRAAAIESDRTLDELRATVSMAVARCAFFGRNLHSRLPLDPMHGRLKLLHACGNGTTLGSSLLLPVDTVNCVQTLKAEAEQAQGTVRVSRQKFTLEHAIGSHACSLEASRRVTNGIPLGYSLFIPVHTVNCVQTLKVHTQQWWQHPMRTRRNTR
jgi:hypothetical protein